LGEARGLSAALLTRRDTIWVTPLRLMPETVRQLGAGGIVSVVNAHLLPPTPEGFPTHLHLKLAMSDAAAADAVGRQATLDQIGRLVGFTAEWQRGCPLVVHCFSGLNRSPAAAFIMLCALNPHTPEPLIALLLRQASDTAAPHRQMVALADHLLQRNGRMIGALDVIGPGIPTAEGRPFSLPAVITSEGEPHTTTAPPTADGKVVVASKT